MIITSSTSTLLVPFQNKIHNKIQTLLTTIHPDFHSTNPILSGSYLLNLFVAPNTYFSDYDFYFDSKESYHKAKSLLETNHEITHQNKNCISFSMKGTSVQTQLITTYFGSPEEIITKHDIHNAKAAYQGNELYFTKEFLLSWSEGTLSLDSFQIKDSYSPQESYYSFASTVKRITKYLKRYELDLTKETVKKLSDLKTFLNQSQADYSKYSYNLNSFQTELYLSECDSNLNFASLQANIDYLIKPQLFKYQTNTDPEPIEF